jgi:hypothetical protein
VTWSQGALVMNELIINIDNQIKKFEQQHNIVLFDDERILKLTQSEISAIDALNQADAFNMHQMKILSELAPLIDELPKGNPERIFFELLISTIFNCYIEDRASSVIIQ